MPAFVVNFNDYKPSPRPTLKWTQAVIQEAPITAGTGEPGSWVDVETKIIPNYLDPQDPPYMSFETELATQVPGWFRIIFKDATGDQEFTAPRLFRGTASYRPSTKAVAVHIKNRTVDKTGNYIGDFTDDTIVTREEVEELAARSESRIVRVFDLDPDVSIPTESQEAVTELVALHTAMLVELTKFSEQVARNTSPYPQLKELFDEMLLEVKTDVLGIEATTTTDVLPIYPGSKVAQYTFPDDTGGMIKWETQF